MELPLYSPETGKLRSTQSTFTNLVQSYIRSILTNRATRNVFFYLLLNLSFTGVEILYGMWTNSLGLIGDGMHMLFDSSALIGSLIASVIVKWPSNDRFTYGYDRVETMTGFVNTLLLVYAAGSIFVEGIERLFDPPEVKTERLLLVAFLGLCVNLVGIFAFEHGGHGHSHGGHGHSHDSHGHSHDDHDDHHGHSQPSNNHSNPLLQGMFLHILADTLGSVGVITSALLIDWFNWTYADPICSIFIATMIFVSVIPLLRDSALVLLQRCPVELEDRLPGCFQRVQKIPGVVSYAEAHFWEQKQSRYIGSLKVQVTHDADEGRIRVLINNIFKQAGVTSFCLQIDKAIQTY